MAQFCHYIVLFNSVGVNYVNLGLEGIKVMMINIVYSEKQGRITFYILSQWYYYLHTPPSACFTLNCSTYSVTPCFRKSVFCLRIELQPPSPSTKHGLVASATMFILSANPFSIRYFYITIPSTKSLRVTTTFYSVFQLSLL